MILLDYSAVAIANMMVAIRIDNEQVSMQFALHMILNSIRRANKQFKSEFGTMVICCDDKKNWRRKTFQPYKYKRRKDKEESEIDWDLINECLDFVKKELRKGFPYLVVQVEEAEADDIIGALARYATANKKPSVVVSNDKDFVQLHSDFVCQWRPCEKAYVRNPDPKSFLKRLIIKGDKDDGVPNIKSPDEIFMTEGKRQKSIFQKELDVWIPDDDNASIPSEFMDNYYRNKRMIDLTFTPNDIKESAVMQFIDGRQKANKPAMTKFFMKNKLRYLHERINDFI